jgi:hypothetical protein
MGRTWRTTRHVCENVDEEWKDGGVDWGGRLNKGTPKRIPGLPRGPGRAYLNVTYLLPHSL